MPSRDDKTAPTGDTPPSTGPGVAPGAEDPQRPQEHDERDEPDDLWKDSSWDLRRGLDIAELSELPAEWRGKVPR